MAPKATSTPTVEERAQQVCELRDAGRPWSEVLAATGFSHSKAELIYMAHVLPAAERKRVADLVKKVGFDAAVHTLRADEKLSWGEIMVRLNASEGKVRKAFREVTGLKSQGQRIGKGGRFYLAEGQLYEAELKPTGTNIPKDAVGREGAVVSAITQRLMNLDFAELKAHAQDRGVKVTKGATKAQLIVAIKKAMGHQDAKAS